MLVETLKGMTWDHPRGLESLVNSNDYLKSQAQISVAWDARSLLAFGDQHISEFYADYDLLIIDHPHIPDAVHAKAVIAFEELVAPEEIAFLQRTSVGLSHDSYFYQGQQWALAIDTAAQVSAYRPDKVDAAPVFWSDVLDIAKSGRLLWPHKPVDAFSTFATLMAQKGSPLTATEDFLNLEIAQEVIEFMIELTSLVPEFCATSNPIEIAEILIESEDYSYGICMYGYSNYSRTGFRERTISYDDLPSFDGRATGSQLGGAGIAVSSAARSPKAAARAAYLLSSPEIQATVYGAAGGQPGNLMAWKSHSLNQLSNNFFENTLRTLEGAWVRPRVLGWPDIQYQSSLIIHRCLTNRTSSRADLLKIRNTYAKYIRE